MRTDGRGVDVSIRRWRLDVLRVALAPGWACSFLNRGFIDHSSLWSGWTEPGPLAVMAISTELWCREASSFLSAFYCMSTVKPNAYWSKTQQNPYRRSTERNFYTFSIGPFTLTEFLNQRKWLLTWHLFLMTFFITNVFLKQCGFTFLTQCVQKSANSFNQTAVLWQIYVCVSIWAFIRDTYQVKTNFKSNSKHLLR